MKIRILYTTVLICLCVTLLSCNSKGNTAKQFVEKNDSIVSWIKASKNTSLPVEKRKLFLDQSYDAINESQLDTSSVRALSEIAYQYLKLKDTFRFEDVNDEAYQLALKLRDTFTLADIHWSSANYYKKKEVFDTAYYHYDKAYKYFENINHQYFAAKMLYSMAFIKGRYRDYSGSEILIFRAISKYKHLEKNKSLYASYNHLALLQSDIKEYDRALFYHNKALEYLDKLQNKGDFYRVSLNNIGNVYLKKGEYLEALKNFNKILEDDSLKIKDIKSYARVLDNRAYCKLLNKDTVNVKNELFESLKIRDSLSNKGAIVISKIHIAEYYAMTQDTLKALTYAKGANELAKDIKNARDYLASLKLLSQLNTENAEVYLEEYIAYNDSLQNMDRKIQNKFTRIAYETDEYIEETKRLTQQKLGIILISFGVVLLLVLILFIRIQKSKNEKLLLENEQQKTNEQVYLITLKQQERLEKEKTKERNRIAEDLHDGILGKLFGVRVGLGFLDIEGDNAIKKQHQQFLEELQIIEQEIREVSHELSDNLDNSKINFTAIITQLIENKSKLGEFKYSVEFDEHICWEYVNIISKVNLYRITQEALLNVIKYASAKNVSVEYIKQSENLIVTIKDDGVGFNIKQRKKGIGIKNMRSRVEKLKGEFSIYSKQGEGTTIKIQIPI